MNNQSLAASKEASILLTEQTKGWGSEDKMQAEYFQWALIAIPASYKYHLFHVPNGGTRNKVEAMKMKAMGLRRGISDLILINPVNMVVHGVELKIKGGYQSTEQKECQQAWGNDNYTLIVEDFLLFKALVLSIFSPNLQ